jgi:hypothetical protein
MAAAWKKKNFDLTRIQYYEPMRTSPESYHTADAPYGVPVLIYNN